MTIDLNKYEEASEMTYELIPEGSYEVEIDSVVKGTTSTGKDKVDIQFSVEGQNGKLFHSPLIEYIDSVLNHFDAPGIDELFGKKAKVKVKHTEYQGKTFANVVIPMPLIPAGEVVQVRLDIKKQDGSFITTGKSGAKYLNGDLTVLSKSFEGKHIFNLFGISSPKGEKYGQIGHSQMLSIINSSYGLEVKDNSEKAVELRTIKDDYSNLDGLKFWITTSIEKSADYPAKNTIGKIITPSAKEWSVISTFKMPGTQSAPVKDLEDEMPDWA